MADKEWHDFEAKLSALALPGAGKLQKLRQRVSSLEGELMHAIYREDYEAASRLREELAVLLSKDPAVLSSSLRRSLEEAIQDQRYDKASVYRNQMNILKLYQPEYNLSGLWQGKSPNRRGVISVNIDYDGDALVATDMNRIVTLMADVSAPCVPTGTLGKVYIQQAKRTGRVPPKVAIDLIDRWDCFKLDGAIEGKRVRGQMYVVNADCIGFLYSGEEGGDGLALAGARGEQRKALGSRQKLRRQIFKRVAKPEESEALARTEEDIQQLLRLERLFTVKGADED